MRLHSRLLALLLVTAAALASGSSAQASDASVRKAVVAQEKRVVAAEKLFAADTEDTISAVGREDARLTVVQLKSALTRARSTVAKQVASGAALRRSRSRYLAALAGGLTGVKTFQQGLAAYDPDAPAKSAELVKTARAQLKRATTRRASAAKAVRGS